MYLPSPQWWLQLLVVVVITTTTVFTTATETPACTPKACTKDIDNEKTVCGSDGLTYPNRCIFEKARCINKNLTLVKRGNCRQQRPCPDWVIYKHSNPDYRFLPHCRSDGSYNLAQCHPDSGFCWCVSQQGLPMPNTSVRWKPDAKPHCGRKKKSTRRRSPSRKARNRICKQPDKAKFNNNLINTFHTEWSREHGITKPHNNETDSMVNQWKFGTLDLNNDGLLDKGEYRDLKKVTKNIVKPKQCAKSFPRSCDVNSDNLISRQEWLECLTRDGMDDGGQQNIGEDNNNNNNNNNNDDQDDYTDPFPSQRPLPHALIGQYDDESSEIRDEDPTDCLSDRQAALVDGHQFYVPECTPDGRYKKVQCYKAAGYCFCVHEDTGKNIPGTSVKNGTPKCDQLTNVNRPMKGCPQEKKMLFLKELLQFLHNRMIETINDTKSLSDTPWAQSKDEKTARWSFIIFDKNKNKILDRNEWKSFKETVSTVKSLRKCGKKLPRYCDINKDRHISMTEWLDCLNVNQSTVTLPTSSRAGKKNPLSMLMED